MLGHHENPEREMPDRPREQQRRKPGNQREPERTGTAEEERRDPALANDLRTKSRPHVRKKPLERCVRRHSRGHYGEQRLANHEVLSGSLRKIENRIARPRPEQLRRAGNLRIAVRIGRPSMMLEMKLPKERRRLQHQHCRNPRHRPIDPRRRERRPVPALMHRRKEREQHDPIEEDGNEPKRTAGSRKAYRGNGEEEEEKGLEEEEDEARKIAAGHQMSKVVAREPH